jgi:O-antigen/teichoic acid export membrane protein
MTTLAENEVGTEIENDSATESKMVALGLGSAWVQFGSSAIISFLRYALLFAYVPQQDLGLALLLMGAVNFLYVFDSALAPAITTEVGRAWTGKLPDQVMSSFRHLYRRAFAIFIPVSIAAFPAVLLFTHDYKNYRLLLALWTMFIVRAALGIYVGSRAHVLTGTGWYFVGRATQVVGEATALAVLFGCLHAGLAVYAIGIAAVADGLASSIFVSWFFKKRVTVRAGIPPDPEIMRRLTANCFAIFGNFIGAFMIFNTDNFFLARFVGLGVVADYSIAYKLAWMIPTLCTPLYNSVYPKYVNSLKDSKRDGIREFFGVVRLNHFLATGIALGIIFLGKYAVDFCVGPGHYIGLGVLGIMVATFMLDNLHYPHHYTFLCKNRTKVLMYTALTAGTLNLAFTAYLAPRYGAAGVAAGTFLAQLASTNWVLPVLSLGALNYRIPEYFYRVVLPVLSIWMLPAAYLVFRLSTN